MMLHLKRNQLLDTLRGEKGGSGSQHTPVEAADSLRSTSYATILDLVSEGEIEGFALGADKIGQCIALDGTLLENPDGSRNFSNVAVDSRSGTQDQDYIAGVPDVENSIAVGVQLKAAVPWVTRISNTSLSAVRLILSVPNGLQKSDQATGDITGYSVAYKIELSVDDGAYATVLNGAFSGKASGKYQRAHRIDLPAATDHWNLRVTRLTADGNSALIADRTDIDAEVDIVDVKMRYPNSALVSVSVDASQFSSIPTRAYFLKGRRVRIPSNYDPVARTYTGVWDGTFKPGYTDNPAWCFLDMATHSRYGLGKFLTDAQVDKWALYNIAQYCDQLVDDGNGGQEPRFTCGLYLQQKADAFKVMQDMATMFRGISYYTGNAIQAVADMPSDASFIYDNTNVIGGKFTYAGSSLSSRQTVALVSWNDLTDFGKAKVEYVEDQEGIARYGVRTTEVTAIGETRRGGAHRAGRHILFTNRMETETVTFSVGLDGDLAAPGQIIKIVDHDRAGKRQGGRIKSATTTVVTVDQAPDAVVGDTLSVNMPDGVIQTRTISAVDGVAITVGTEFTEAPQAEAVWTVEKTTLAAQTFRVISVKENNADDDTAGFSLSCIQYAPEKFAAIDDGLILQPRPITSLAAPTQDPVTGISIAYHIVYRQGTAVAVMRIEWVKPAGAVRYAVEWRRGDGTWVSAGTGISETVVEVEGVHAGVYQARITAYNVNGVSSVPAISAAVQIDGKNVAPPAPILRAVGGLFEIDLSWDFPTSSNVSDTSYTEIQSDTSAGMTTAVQVGTYAYPLNVAVITGLTESETKWVRARLVDKSGNIGDWSVPVSATTSTTDNLFQPIQAQIDDLQTKSDDIVASVTQETSDRTQAVLDEANTRQAQIDAQAAALNQEIGDRQTAITNEQTQRQSGDLNEANSREVLATQMRGGYTGTDLNQVTSGLIAAERDARTSATDSLAQQMTLLSAGVGELFDYESIWYFTNSADGWTDGTSAVGWSASWITMPTGWVYSPAGLNVNGDEYQQVGFRVRKIGTPPAWDGQVAWRNGAWSANLAVDEPAWDAAGVGLVTVNSGWTGSISQIRLQTNSVAGDSANHYEVDWIAIGRPAPGASAASLADEQTARATADTAEVTARQQLSVKLTGLQDPTGKTLDQLPSGLLVDEKNARVAADASQVSATQALQARMPTGTGTLATEASVTTESTARADADSALSTRTGVLEARMPSGSGTLATDAQVTSEQTARANADTAMASDISLLGAHNAGKTAFDLNSNTVTIDGTQTVAQRLSSLQAGTDAVNARVDSEQSARQSGDAANASAITVVQAATLQPGMNFIDNPSAAGPSVTGWSHAGPGNFNAGAWTMGPCFVMTAGAAGQFSYAYYRADVPAAAAVCFSLNVSGSMQDPTDGIFYLELVAQPSGTIFKSGGSSRQGNVSGTRSNTYISGTPPAGTTQVDCRVVTRGVISGNLLFWGCKLEYGTTPSPYTTDAQLNATASVATQAKASVDAVTGKVNASYTLSLDANGRVVGYVFQNNGTTGSIVFRADVFSIVSPTESGARTEYSNNSWKVYDSAGTLRVQMGVLP